MKINQLTRNVTRLVNRPYSHKRYRRWRMWMRIKTNEVFKSSEKDPNMRKARNRMWRRNLLWRMKADRIRERVKTPKL
jgi:hypothetical protein